MQKTVLLMLLVFTFFATFISFHAFYEYQHQKRGCEDEIRNAASLLIISIEENTNNHEVIKTGNRQVIPDNMIILEEFNAFLSNCSYIDRADVKSVIVMFDGAISYFDCNDQEIYTEAVIDASDSIEYEGRIKRQLYNIFHEEDFEISPRMFDELGDKQILLIYERPYRIISSRGGSGNIYAFSKLSIK